MTYAQAFAAYTGRSYAGNSAYFTGAYPTNIRHVCQVAAASAKIGTASAGDVDLLILQGNNGIANVGKGAISVGRHNKGLDLPKGLFQNGVLIKMLAQAKVSNTISHKQYDAWKNDFFDEAGFKAKVVFNHLVFALFPEQFCAVPSIRRLRAIGGRMIQDGLLPASVGHQIAAADWFDLCGIIMPAVAKGLPGHDYADCSAFVAAIGVTV